MALDSRDKRSSAILPGCPWRGMLPVPDGAITSPDWQHVGLVYRGIAAQQALFLVSATTLDAFTVTATGSVPVSATSTSTIGTFTVEAQVIAPVTLTATPTIAAFTSSATVLPGWAVVGSPTFSEFTATATAQALIQAQVNATMEAFTSAAFVAGSSFGKYRIRGRGSGRYIVCRPL